MNSIYAEDSYTVDSICAIHPPMTKKEHFLHDCRTLGKEQAKAERYLRANSQFITVKELDAFLAKYTLSRATYDYLNNNRLSVQVRFRLVQLWKEHSYLRAE